MYIKNVNIRGIETAKTWADNSGAAIKSNSIKILLNAIADHQTIGRKNKLVKTKPFNCFVKDFWDPGKTNL